MKLLKLLSHFRGTKEQSASRCNTGGIASQSANAMEMQAKKVISQFNTIARSYNLGLWSKEEKWKYQQDFAIMLAHEDLKSIRLELLDQDNSVLFEFKIHFSGQRAGGKLVDPAAGVELPVIDQQSVTKNRIVLVLLC